MMDSNLIKSYFESVLSANQEPESKTEENKESEPDFEEEEENEEEICDTRENSELDNSFIDRRISNNSVFEPKSPKVFLSSILSETKQYYSETIENLKNENKDEFDYKKSKNYITKEEYKKDISTEIKKAKQNSYKKIKNKVSNTLNKNINISNNYNTKMNNIQFQRVNFKMNLVKTIQLKGNYIQLVYYNRFIGYRYLYFSNKCIPSGNTEKYQVISKDKKGDFRNFKKGSNTKDEEETKVEEPKKDEIEVEEYKTRSQRMNEKKKFYNKKYGNNNYGNNYYNGKKHYQSKYRKNFKNYNRFNKSEY